MSYYDAPPSRAYRPSRRRDSFTDPLLCNPRNFHHQEPQYADDYPRGRAHSPPGFTGGMPRTYQASPERDTYAHSPGRSPSPPPGLYTEWNPYETPHRRFQSPFYSNTPNSAPPPARDYSFPPPPPLTDSSPEAYTYEDEEPERIPIAPMPWNGHASSASKEELINYFIDRGIHPKVAAAQVDREFTAHAPQHVAGQAHAGLPRAQVSGRQTPGEERWREEDTSPSPGRSRYTTTQAQRRARRRSLSPTAYRSPSPVSSPKHRYSASSRNRAASPPRSYGKYAMPPHPPSHNPQRDRRHRPKRETETGSREERGEKKERRVPSRTPSPPPAATYQESGGERKKSTRR
ncbi:hypothetical protein BKA61DRAFT_580868 [Leptodontidium sp. MPI-SDFR-AT-0119]|nr:hypothetical protein BKA61DRAFT_580868 [Leptodontidium sp. MPI-SDFR-AT-0119]